MDSGMMIIAMVLLATITIPIFLIGRNVKKQSKQLYNGLNAQAFKNNGTLTRHTEHTNFALGLDETAKAIYYFKKTEDTEVSKQIDLNVVTSCEVIKKTRRIKKAKGFDEVIEKITLIFVNKNGETTHIEFYNEDENVLSDELTVAKKWNDTIQQILSKKQVASGTKKESPIAAVLS
ncbi:hypothetical protein G5B37_06835 [Rasiella rasia]|uniref:Uncharacterized protein n=1 Tax=Rasiella rasia TaxID=2744027 RepID=A0A6G6GL94_9FLAO|nr:hypothetical protein [Rasiella rasia]QIE59287.1 hypothetical protein G5B37_06835 [Rasiella rasia]